MSEPLLLSVQQVAELLSVSKRTVYLMIKDGDLIATDIGRRVLVARDELNRFIGRNSRPAKDGS